MATNTGIGEQRLAESALSTLQDLSARCHDSEQGYRRSAQDASDSDLKQQFEQLANERSSMAAELDRLIREHGGEPSWKEGSLTGAAHRMWVDLRTALSRNERQVILEEVARGESAAEEAYDSALRQNLPANVMQVVRQHHRRVRETRNRYRAMAGTGQTTSFTGELAQRLTSGTEGVTHYMQERPLMSTFAVFAVGFLAGALAVSMMSGQQSSYRQGSHRSW
ncbi:MAG TPA: PA2169 family four-helix-bundle protein [Alphaproteobacteria bacterium]|nr:PA2169 family four-helix-bundle protein [Alphaproteobacteria bacterium]